MKHPKRSPAFPLLSNPSSYCEVGGKKKRKYVAQLDAELAKPAAGLTQYICSLCGYWHNGTPNAYLEKKQSDHPTL